MVKKGYTFRSDIKDAVEGVSLPSTDVYVYADGVSVPIVEQVVPLLPATAQRSIISHQHADMAATMLLRRSITTTDKNEITELLISIIAFHGNLSSVKILEDSVIRKLREDHIQDNLANDTETEIRNEAHDIVQKTIDEMWPPTSTVAQKVYNTTHSINITNRVPLYRDVLAYSTKVALGRIKNTPATKKQRKILEQQYADLSRTMFNMQGKVRAAAELSVLEEARETERKYRQTNVLNPMNLLKEGIFNLTGGLFGSVFSPDIREQRAKIHAARWKDMSSILQTISTEGFQALFALGNPSSQLRQMGSSGIEAIGEAIQGGGGKQTDTTEEQPQQIVVSPLDQIILDRLAELENDMHEWMGRPSSKNPAPDPNEPVGYEKTETAPKKGLASLSRDLFSAAKGGISAFLTEQQMVPFGKQNLPKSTVVNPEPTTTEIVEAADAIQNPGSFSVEVDETGHETLNSTKKNIGQLAKLAEEVTIIKQNQDEQQGGSGGGGGIGLPGGGAAAPAEGAAAGSAEGIGAAGGLGELIGPLLAIGGIAAAGVVGAFSYGMASRRNHLGAGMIPTHDEIIQHNRENEAADRLRAAREGANQTPEVPETAQAANTAPEPSPRYRRDGAPARVAAPDESKFSRITKFEIKPNVGGLDRPKDEYQVYL